MEYHPAADIFPLDEEHIPELAEDIKKQGLLCPIETLDGKIIDGRRRFLACKKAKVEPQFVNVKSLVEDPIAYVLSLNLERRHLSVSQRAMVGNRARAMYEEQAKERQKEHGGTAPGKSKTLVKKSTQVSGKSRDQAGAAVGVSGFSIDRARTVQEKGIPEVAQAVEADRISVNRDAEIAKLPTEEQPAALQEALQPRSASPRPKKRNEEPEGDEPEPGKLRGKGIFIANEAIDCLKRIPKNDALRKRGFQLVTDWIRHNK